MRKHLAPVIGLLLSLCVGSLPAAPVSLDGSEQWTLSSAEGREYRIMVSLPEGKMPYTGGYPVVYLLDGNAYFAAFHAAKRSQENLRVSILSGIGYRSDTPLDFRRRSFDFSPPVPAARNDPPQGGQDQFLDFIEQRLMPEVARRYKVDEDHRSLVGHSFAGMFATYTLFTRPHLFQQLVAISPSLWWRDHYLLAHEQAFTQQVREGRIKPLHNSLTLLMAERDCAQEIEDAGALYRRLDALSGFGLRSSFQVEAGEDHMSVPFRVASRVLTALLETRRF